MFGPARILLTIAASTVALPVFAQASVPTTAFDGIYAGVSRERADEKGVMGIKTCPLGGGAPLRLIIVKGIARMGDSEGSVSPQGVLVMRRPNGDRYDGQIDSQGIRRGQGRDAVG